MNKKIYSVLFWIFFFFSFLLPTPFSPWRKRLSQLLDPTNQQSPNSTWLWASHHRLLFQRALRSITFCKNCELFREYKTVIHLCESNGCFHNLAIHVNAFLFLNFFFVSFLGRKHFSNWCCDYDQTSQVSYKLFCIELGSCGSLSRIGCDAASCIATGNYKWINYNEFWKIIIIK